MNISTNIFIDKITGSRILKPLIVVLILTGSIVQSFILPKIIGSRFLLLIFCTPLLIAGVIILLYHPSLGLAMLVVSDLIIPFSVGTGSQTNLSIPILLIPILTGVGVLTWLTYKKPLHLFDSKTTRPLFYLIVIVLLSFINGLLPWYDFAQQAPLTAQIGGAALYIFSILTFLLIATQIQEVRWLKWLVWIFLSLGSIYVLSSFITNLGSLVSRYFPYGVTGAVFWVWLVVLSFSQAVFNRDMKPAFRLILLGLTCAAVYVGLIKNIGWTSGWLPAMIALLVVIWMRAPRIGLLVTIFMGIGIAVFYKQSLGFVMVGDNPYSLETRLAAWKILAEIVKVSPILGLGPANYHFYTPLFPIMGYYVQFNSHNNYIDFVVQIGMLGLAVFLWFLWETGRLGWRLRSIAPEGFERAYVYGAIGGLAGMIAAGMLGDWVIPFVYNIGYNGFRASLLGWLFLGGLVVLERIQYNSSPATAGNL